MPRPPKGYHAPRAGGPGRKPSPMGTMLKTLKRFKILENESIFQNYQYFSCPKNQYFLIKISKIEHILQKFLNFSKNYSKHLKFSIFMEWLYKFRVIFRWILLSSWEIYKTSTKWAKLEKEYWNWDENSWKLLRKATEICIKKFKIINIWRIISIGQSKLRNKLAEVCAFGPKMKKCDFLIKISVEN